MRKAFVETLTELARGDSRILLLTGDLGFMALEPFAEKFPDRFFNVGVAEQNMVGLATGLAEAGFIPFVYSIVPFAALRPYEFIRNGPVQHQLPVRIVGVGGGFDYGHNGLSHYGLEDIAVMRAQPAMSVIAPADQAQARTAFKATWNRPGPIYYRLGKDDRITIPELGGRFELGRAETIGEGADLLFITTGSISCEAVAAAKILSGQGFACTVMVVAGVAPPPTEDLVKALSRFPLVLTVEAHYRSGGIGSLVSETVAERGLGCRVVRCGVEHTPRGVTGSQNFLNHANGISALALAETATRLLSKRTQ
jgi:transketolase